MASEVAANNENVENAVVAYENNLQENDPNSYTDGLSLGEQISLPISHNESDTEVSKVFSERLKFAKNLAVDKIVDVSFSEVNNPDGTTRYNRLSEAIND